MPAVLEAIGRGIVSEDGPGHKHETLSEEITKVKKDWVMVQVIECLPSKCIGLRSDPSTTKNKYTKKPEKTLKGIRINVFLNDFHLDMQQRQKGYKEKFCLSRFLLQI
jgi:hypothetical protein